MRMRCPKMALVVLLMSAQSSALLTPVHATKLVADAIVKFTTTGVCDQNNKTQTCAFGRWGYGPAIINDALLQASKLPNMDYTQFVNAKLDTFLETKGETAFNLTHGIHMDWGYSIGDRVGLYPFAYLARAQYYASVNTGTSTYDNTSDLLVATEAASRYIFPWPLHWEDGTLSRDQGWTGMPTDKKHEYIWGDDGMMGLTLVNRLFGAGGFLVAVVDPGPYIH
jgi:hypothetical protein